MAPRTTSILPAKNFSWNRSFAWSLLSDSAPGGRTGAGFAAPGSGEGVLFGGESASGLVNSTLLYNESENQWTPVSPPVAPTPRSDFGFSADTAQGNALLFGGLVNSSTGAVSNQTWEFSPSTDRWTNVSSTFGPTPRSDPAFAVGDGVALLYGGRAPNASGVGELVYYDTWVLNLTSLTWTRINTTGLPTPGPLYGASLVWDPAGGRFLLYGGCYPCSSDVWAFSPANGTWSLLPTVGPAPPGRVDAVFRWDPIQRVDILFGGENSTGTLNTTFLFDPATALWSPVFAPQAPVGRADAAADFLSTVGNETLLVTGGTEAGTLLSDTWRFSPVSNLTIWVANASSRAKVSDAFVGVGAGPILSTNSTGGVSVKSVVATETTINASAPGFAPLVKDVWIPSASNVTEWLNLTPLPPAVADVIVRGVDGLPMPNVSVNIAFGNLNLTASPRLTNRSGVALFTGVPSGAGVVAASKPGYHNDLQKVDFPSGQLVEVNLTMVALLQVNIHTAGRLPNGTLASLRGVSVMLGGSKVGTTDIEGWDNFSTLEINRVSVWAGVYGFLPSQGNITINFTGVRTVYLTLIAEPFPILTVAVRGLVGPPVDLLLKNALVNITSVSTPPTGPVRESLLTGTDGEVSLILAPGNYTVAAWAKGFTENDSIRGLFAAVSATINRTVDLIPLPPSSLHVLVRSSAGNRPTISGASVVINFTSLDLVDGATFPAIRAINTSARGWSNFTNLPASLVLINGSAPGYFSNLTALYLGWGENFSPFVLELTPVPPAYTDRLSILPGGNVLLPLLVLPGASLAGALVYLTVLRNPPRRAAPRAAPSAFPEGPVDPERP